MIKSENNKYQKAEAELDSHLCITHSNSIFKHFYINSLKPFPVKITQLIEFDDPLNFETSLKDFRKGKKCNTSFQGKVISSAEERSIVVTVKSDKNQSSKWTNETICLTFEEKNHKAFYDMMQQQSLLQEELEYMVKELYTNQMLLSQKVNLLKIISKDLSKITPQVNRSIQKEIQKIILLIKSQKLFQDNWSKMKVHFVKIHKGFFQVLRKRSKKITEKDLRHCAYLKIGLSVKETAELLSIEPKSVEMARYRIKKKLNLKRSEKLADYLGGI